MGDDLKNNDLRKALAAQPKDRLVAILADICAAYPHLVDEFALLSSQNAFDPEKVVGQIFIDLRYEDDFRIDDVVTRMENVARHAARLIQEGQGVLARRTYYVLIDSCAALCEDYGAHDLFPSHIPSDFVAAYEGLVYDQSETHLDTILKEIDTMLDGEFAPMALGLDWRLIELQGTIEPLDDDE